MLPRGRKSCRDCYERWWLWGDGVCSGCAGVGKSLSLGSLERECRACHGTGICPTCNGDGGGRPPSLTLFLPQSLAGRILLGLALLVAICVAGFKYSQWRYASKAMTAAEAVHRVLSQGMVSQVYINADQRFRMSMTYESAVGQLEAIRKKLGDCQYSDRPAWSVAASTRGIYVVTIYSGYCANGYAIETLKWHIEDGVARLAGFRVSSQALLK